MENRWKPINLDERGYTHTYECPDCESRIFLTSLVKKCDYEYCPYCGKSMISVKPKQKSISGQMSVYDYPELLP